MIEELWNTPVPFDGKLDLAPTPPMGWNSWNSFRCHDISETKLLEVADVMVDNGMLEAGYNIFVVDDCWQALSRGEDGKLHSHPRRFPSGMKWLGEQLKAKGFRFGLYGSPGRKTCAMIYDRYPGRDLGSFGREELDSQTFADWGVDFLKYDWCEANEDNTGLRYPEAFERMALALEKTGRPIIYSISEYGRTKPWTWAGEYGHMWRTSPDIQKNWGSVLSIADIQAEIAEFNKPHHWNDPDMLQVGNPGLTLAENQSHFALWCFFAAPLMAGNDPRSMSPEVLAIFKNANLIRIDQDPLGVAATRRTLPGGTQLWSRPLVSGSARLIVNVSDEPLELVISNGKVSASQGWELEVEKGESLLTFPSDSSDEAAQHSIDPAHSLAVVLAPHASAVLERNN